MENKQKPWTHLLNVCYFYQFANTHFAPLNHTIDGMMSVNQLTTNWLLFWLLVDFFCCCFDRIKFFQRFFASLNNVLCACVYVYCLFPISVWFFRQFSPFFFCFWFQFCLVSKQIPQTILPQFTVWNYRRSNKMLLTSVCQLVMVAYENSDFNQTFGFVYFIDL